MKEILDVLIEFAELLKKKCYEDFQETGEMLCPYVTEDDIDDILKQFVEMRKKSEN